MTRTERMVLAVRAASPEKLQRAYHGALDRRWNLVNSGRTGASHARQDACDMLGALASACLRRMGEVLP